MGVYLTPIIIKKIVRIKNLTGWKLAIDANGYLYQFLSLIRLPNGTPLKDKEGKITSHLAGLLFRTTKLLCDYGIEMIFIFDGKPPILKSKEIIKRRELREKATKEWIEALEKKDYAKAFSKAIASSKLSKEMIEDSKKLLNFMGIPYIQAPGEAEAQAAYLASIGEVDAVESKDYDSLLFGTPKLVRFLTLTGKEFLPSKRIFRKIYPEIIELEKIKEKLGITREQLIDIAILIGTDFNEGIYGIGPKKALKLIKQYGSIENLPSNIRNKIDENFNEIRKIFLNPEINKQYKIEYGIFQENKIYDFLCNEKGFNKERVKTAIERLKKFYERKNQEKLEKWIN